MSLDDEVLFGRNPRHFRPASTSAHRGFDGLAEQHCWVAPTSGSVRISLLWMDRHGLP